MTDTEFEVVLRPLRARDWDWIARWFEDRWLNAALGPVDAAWVARVAEDGTGVHLVAEEGGLPFGLVGVQWGDAAHAVHGVTDIAIDPVRRGQGLGRRVLAAALEWQEHPRAAGWIAYVARGNVPPVRMLLACGWREDGWQGEMQRFRRVG